MIRFKLVKGVYTDLWILALCIDGYPRYEAKYATFEDAWRALWRTFEYQFFLGYPVGVEASTIRPVFSGPGPELRVNRFH